VARRKLHKRAFAEIDRGALGTLVFNARKQRALTQAGLAQAIGRDRPWLSDVETGKITHVPDDDLAALAVALSLSPPDVRAAHERTAGRLRTEVPARLPAGPERQCPVCARISPPDANFCAHCGAALPHEIECGRCGRRNPATANFCAYCGRRMGAGLGA